MTEHHGAPECDHSCLMQGSSNEKSWHCTLSFLGETFSELYYSLRLLSVWSHLLPIFFSQVSDLTQKVLPAYICLLPSWASYPRNTLKSTFFLAFVSQRTWDFPGGSDGRESACNVGDLGLIPGSGRAPGEGKGYPLQYYGLENSMDREAWQPTVHGVAKSQTWLKRLSKQGRTKVTTVFKKYL